MPRSCRLSLSLSLSLLSPQASTPLSSCASGARNRGRHVATLWDLLCIRRSARKALCRTQPELHAFHCVSQETRYCQRATPSNQRGSLWRCGSLPGVSRLSEGSERSRQGSGRSLPAVIVAAYDKLRIFKNMSTLETTSLVFGTSPSAVCLCLRPQEPETLTASRLCSYNSRPGIHKNKCATTNSAQIRHPLLYSLLKRMLVPCGPRRRSLA